MTTVNVVLDELFNTMKPGASPAPWLERMVATNCFVSRMLSDIQEVESSVHVQGSQYGLFI